MSEFVDENNNEIAIIGMVGRLPGANNIDKFWHNLCNGIESISFFSEQDIELTNIDDPHILNYPNYVKAGGILENAELFDASFFGYSPREAEIMDPQARLFLESAWEALENAGYDSENFPGRVGVYAGASINTYLLFNLFSNPDLIASIGAEQIKFSNHQDLLTTRVAYKLNLQGSGITIQTACSTSLVAVHLACQSLLCGECDMALAGGVSIYLPQKAGYLHQEGGILSPDGHCRAFDAQAQGTVRGNGIGIVVLKRLADALADGDCIHAVIKGSAINNDGSLKVGYTAPSVEGQAKVIAEAQAIAGIDPETISYVEAHGTGTSLGDPIEVTALTQAFRRGTKKQRFCGIGSVKTNIGHLNAAAGIAGLIKTVLALKHKKIPPSLHFEQPNPQIDFANSPFYVNCQLSEWQTDKHPRRAGISSFGIGGTNAHVILEEAPTVAASSSSRPWQLLVLSAKTRTALEHKSADLVNYLKQHPHLNLADVAHTLQVGRKTFSHRRSLVCCDIQDVLTTLATPDQQRVFTSYQESCNRSVVFMFPGQGAQYVNMAREIYETEVIFREQVNYCCERLKPHLKLDLKDILYPSAAQTQAAQQQLKQTSLTQPALFVIEYALAKLWMAWGVNSQAMIGHSIGEYVAACLAGVFSLEQALELVAIRGRFMQQLQPGAMLSVSLSTQQAQPLLNEELSLAASNAPSLCVISGTTDAVDALQSRLIEQGVDCRRLHTSHAFHSQMMDAILESFAQQVRQVNLQPPQIPFVSNVTGTWITATEAMNPYYWARHLRQTVLFSEGITLLLQQPQVLLEVGPGRTLSTLAKRQQVSESLVLTSLPHPNEPHSDVEFMLKALSRLWLAGVQINWSGFYAHEQRHRIPLPTYPFEGQRYWIEPQAKVENLRKLEKKPQISDWFYVPSWQRTLLPTQSSQHSCWLVFVDSLDIGEQIAQRLECQDVIRVQVGRQFAKFGDGVYTINPQQPEDYDALLAELKTLNRIPEAIAHFWSLTPNYQTQSSPEFFTTCQELGFYSLLFLAQALGKQQMTDALQIIVVSNHLHEVLGDEHLSAEKATVLGMCKVIPQEYPYITCRSVDVVIPESGNILENQILAELTAQSNDTIVAYRGSHRWVQIFKTVKLDTVTAPTTGLTQGGVYLITGGLGGIGLVLAEYLAQTVKAKLILLGRSSLPDQAEWEQWLTTHNEHDDISRKIKKVQKLEALGAQVLVISADVANYEQMHWAIAYGIEQFGELNGVIHTAGVKSVNTVQQISRTECEQQFYAKVQGLYVLEQVLQDKKIDFCLLMSSLASVLGLLGKAAYPAAHIFIDAFAHKHNQTNNTKWLSINWDNWLGEQATSQINEGFLTAQEGVEAFQRILNYNLTPQILVSTVDLQSRLSQWIERTTKDKKLASITDSLALHSRPNLSNNYVAPRNQLEQTLANIWQQLLGVESVGIHDNFFELGGDSVLGIQLIARANQTGLKLNPKQVFEYQTIAELAMVANTEQVNQAEQGLVTGSLPLAPIQHWFFAQNQPEPHHWNQSVMLETLQVIEPSLLKQALQHLLIHHDALRLRFTRNEFGWQQVNADSDVEVPLICLDLSKAPQQQLAIEKTAAELQASLNLSSGPIILVALFNLGANLPSRILIIIHHLAIDVMSWRILIEDLQTIYQHLSQGLAIQLAPKTTSFKQWTQQLTKYAQSAQLRQEVDYWQTQLHQVFTLPRDYPEGANTVASVQTVSVKLSVAQTQVLLQLLPKVYRTKMEEVLLAALLPAFAQWTGKTSPLIDLEGNGRESIFEDIDLSRTVGWFTTISPVLFNLEKVKNPQDVLQTVKEQLRRIPNEGIGYGLLRYLNEDEAIRHKLQALPQAEVIFLYLGQFEESLSQSSLFKLRQDFSQVDRSPQGYRPHLLQITGFVSRGQLQLNFIYSQNVYKHSTIEGLAQRFIETIQLLIAECQSSEAGSYTPTDFSATSISQKDLNKLLAQASLSDERK